MANNNLIRDVDDLSLKQQAKELITNHYGVLIFAVVLIIMLITSIMIFNSSPTHVGVAYSAEEQEEIAKQKEELTTTYNNAGVELVDPQDFVVSKPNDEIFVDTTDEKKQELEEAKDSQINNLINDRGGFSALFDDEPDDGGGDNPSNNDPSGGGSTPTNPENEYGDPNAGNPKDDEDKEDNEEDKTNSEKPNKNDPKSVEEKLLEKINSWNTLTNNFVTKSSSEDNYPYEVPFQRLLSSIQTGDPSLDDNYDYHDDLTNAQVFNSMLYKIYLRNMSEDESYTWDYKSYQEEYGQTNVMENCMKNGYYALTFDKIDYIEKSKETFLFDGEEVAAKYVVYCGERTIYLSPSYCVLDIK